MRPLVLVSGCPCSQGRIVHYHELTQVCVAPLPCPSCIMSALNEIGPFRILLPPFPKIHYFCEYNGKEPILQEFPTLMNSYTDEFIYGWLRVLDVVRGSVGKTLGLALFQNIIELKPTVDSFHWFAPICSPVSLLFGAMVGNSLNVGIKRGNSPHLHSAVLYLSVRDIWGGIFRTYTCISPAQCVLVR